MPRSADSYTSTTEHPRAVRPVKSPGPQSIPFAKADVAINAIAPPRQIDQALSRLELGARDNGSAPRLCDRLRWLVSRLKRRQVAARGFVVVPISIGRDENEILGQDRVAADKETA